jgi:hypothetical protein
MGLACAVQRLRRPRRLAARQQCPVAAHGEPLMSVLAVRDAAECHYDRVSLGEVMLRLDPDEGRIRTTRNFRVWEGGGEYNVARGLRRCFGLRTAIVTALVNNDVGRLLEDLMLQAESTSLMCIGSTLTEWGGGPAMG